MHWAFLSWKISKKNVVQNLEPIAQSPYIACNRSPSLIYTSGRHNRFHSETTQDSTSLLFACSFFTISIDIQLFTS